MSVKDDEEDNKEDQDLEFEQAWLQGLERRDLLIRRGRNHRIYQKFISKEMFTDCNGDGLEDELTTMNSIKPENKKNKNMNRKRNKKQNTAIDYLIRKYP